MQMNPEGLIPGDEEKKHPGQKARRKEQNGRPGQNSFLILFLPWAEVTKIRTWKSEPSVDRISK